MNIKIVINLFEFKIGDRSTVLAVDGDVLCITDNQLSAGECAALICGCFVSPVEKPKKFIAVEIELPNKSVLQSSYERGEVVITNADNISQDVILLIKAITIGVESACDWNDSIDFGMVEIEGALACKKGLRMQSDPYQNVDPDKSVKWLSGWKAVGVNNDNI